MLQSHLTPDNAADQTGRTPKMSTHAGKLDNHWWYEPVLGSTNMAVKIGG